MNILVLNCGSSSIKYQFLNMSDEPKLLAKGLVERVGLKDGEHTYKNENGNKVNVNVDIPDHTFGIKLVIEMLTNPDHGVIKNIEKIHAVGHRVVHGGEKFTSSVLINEEVKEMIKECIDLAPLHNPANLKGIEAMEKISPNIPQVAVFDTSFHQTMPKHVYLYGIPYEYYEKYKVRRYGFHGTSHSYVAKQSAELVGKRMEDLKIVTCHLGNGASITAVDRGKSVDTSMGMTPVEGLIMGTRCGDTGLGAILFLMEKEHLKYKEANEMVNKNGGLLGISGISPDMRDLQNAAAEGHERAAIAIDMFTYRIKKYIGAYGFAMGGLDMVVFTGGIGENSKIVREKVCSNLESFGLILDIEKNNMIMGKPAVISKPESKIYTVVMPTNEELVIANDTKTIVEAL
ncbi:MAG: acetate kinase [Marinilabiliales bacterium]